METPQVQTSEKAVDVLLSLIAEEWGEIHHIESERAAFTNILIVIESGAVALITQGKVSLATLPICVLLVLVGLVGLLTTAKYYERFRFAQTRLTEMYHQVDRLCPAARVLDSLRQANLKHDAGGRGLTFGGVHLKRLPLNIMWRLVHGMSIGAGLILGAVALARALR